MELTHAYGSARDIPVHLHALCTGSADEVDRAFDELWNKTLHQGVSIYTATVPVMEFGFRMIAAGTLRCRARMLSYNGHALWIARSLRNSEDDEDDEDDEDESSSDRVVAQQCIEVGLGNRESVVKFMDDADVNVRRVAPFALAQLALCIDDAASPASKLLVAALGARLAKEPEPTVLASLLCAAGELGTVEPGLLPLVVARMEDGQLEESVRSVAAYALSKAGVSLTGSMRDRLISAVRNRRSVDAALLLGRGTSAADPEADNPWFDMRPHFSFLRELLKLPPENIPSMVDLFVDLVATDSEYTFERVSLPILEYVVGSVRLDRIAGKEDLAAAQRQVLKALYENEDVWGNRNGVFLELPKRFGFSNDQAGRELLGRLIDAN